MPQPLKPAALRPGDAVRVLSLASPVEEARLERGLAELGRLGWRAQYDRAQVLAADGFFSGSAESRLAALQGGLAETETRAIFCSRGGYGSTMLLDALSGVRALADSPKAVLGYSDLTSLQIFLWQRFRWVTFYGAMVASGMDKGAGAEKGYDRDSLQRALTETREGWPVELRGEPLASGISGVAEGTLLGGCLTLIETSLGTPWELETEDSVLVLEDRAMKPWQVDRAFVHLRQAGKFLGVQGIVLGDFPECEGPAGTETVRDVAARVLAPLGVPIAWGAPVGHTMRPMLTLPLGVRARLTAKHDAGSAVTRLDILEPAVV
jgi:muramoyltetrapeptide carboxypeptidase